ncbi:MAG TPA: CDP-alcohol phosphatidyltransferase family protein [Gemmatimonadaceae bacterium]|nr:CDP-alcohol phosphatidyltransferase family protein [Gemmatimonadaceae bacterium]
MPSGSLTPEAAHTSTRIGWRLALGLTLLRLALAPVLLVMSTVKVAGPVIATVLAVGFLSDVFDGVVARHFGVATPGLRGLDSTVDTIFYLAIAYAVFRLHPGPLRALAWPIGIVLAGEALNYAAAYLIFKRGAGYHAWSAKAWGALLFVALLMLLTTGSSALLPIALIAGIIAQADTLAITLTLPQWQSDVPSALHALRIRRGAVGSPT